MKNFLNNQGRRKSQIDFSTKIVSYGYYGMILCIIYFILSEWLK